MMRSAGGALAVAVAALLVCCSADPHQEQDVSGSEHVDAGHKSVGGGNLVRAVRDIRHSMPGYILSRRFDFASPYGGRREPWTMLTYGDEFPKRNFDEIDRSELSTFMKKRNFDEIDRSSMPFPYATKRFYHLYGPNYLDIDTPVASFDKKSLYGRQQAGSMDEIDLSQLPIGSKRSADDYPLLPHNLL